MKIKKFLLVCFSFLCFFGFSISVSANSYDDLGYFVYKDSDLVATDQFPYLIFYENNGVKRGVISKSPVTFAKHDPVYYPTGCIYFSGYEFSFNSDGTSTRVQFDRTSSGHTLFDGTYSVLSSNHTVNYTDGDIFFNVPLPAIAELASPLVGEVYQNSQVIVTGSMICLAVLAICLVVLPRLLHKFTNS